MKNKKVILVCIISLVIVVLNFNIYAHADINKSEEVTLDTDLKLNDYLKEKFYFYTRSENDDIISFERFTGKDKICELNMDKGEKKTLQYQSEIKDGEFNIAVANPHNKVITIIKGNTKGSKDIIAEEKGIYTVWIVGNETRGKVQILFDEHSEFEGLKCDFVYGNGCRYKSKFKKEFTLNTAENKLLTLNNPFGSIKIIKGVGKNIEVEAYITIINNDKEYAEKISDSIIEIKENELKIKSYEYRNSSWDLKHFHNFYDHKKMVSIKVDYLIKVPKQISVNIENKYGNIDISDLNGNINIGNSFGDIDLKNIDGYLKLKNTHGNVTLNNISGDLYIKNSYGYVNIDRTSGKVEVDNCMGKICVKNVDKDVKLKNQYDSIQAFSIKGNVDIKGYNCTVEIEGVEGNVEVDNEHGNITVREVKKGLTIEGYIGNVDVKNGCVFKEDIYIENKYGDVTLDIPKEQGGDFDIKCEYGDIKNDFELNVYKNEIKKSIHKKIGESDIDISINNYNGSVELIGK
ncbi:DUF4097 family beta strand repeat-containing protein [Oceanirhabdus sp. W0125-5]|uniref:DUF4097 family beta strand repeat-containing protein n=1 Tax=Oceanirhabdus sp. W0125-5 TaxID=2999116 RepID=UPI0022F3371A|nr:hypothetical protein [Oceanirhabdus sp. W0125-5]WBW96248.1 hypothetical protein OW730_21525 [Oceanirhabdus sp. W0125-5]